MLRDDFLLRLIEQVGAALARALSHLKEGKAAEGEAELTAAERSLGLPPGVERLTPSSVAMMLGGGDKVVLYAQILAAQARLAEAQGRTSEIAHLHKRALGVLSGVRDEAISPALEDAHQLLLRELS